MNANDETAHVRVAVEDQHDQHLEEEWTLQIDSANQLCAGVQALAALGGPRRSAPKGCTPTGLQSIIVLIPAQSN